MAIISNQADKKSQDEFDFFAFGDDIPVIKMVPAETYLAINDHIIRNAMVFVLRKGIMDEKHNKKRYVMNINEIVDAINQLSTEVHISSKFQGLKVGKKIKQTALYHHRDKLLELDIIQEAATILEGKRYVTYYARTARAFIGDTHKESKLETYNDFIKNVIHAIKPNETNSDVDGIITQMNMSTMKAHDEIVMWLEEHVDLINTHNLDALVLYELLMLIHPQRTQGDFMTKLQNIFDL